MIVNGASRGRAGPVVIGAARGRGVAVKGARVTKIQTGFQLMAI